MSRSIHAAPAFGKVLHEFVLLGGTMHPFFHILTLEIPAYGFFAALAIVVACGLALMRVKRRGGDPDALLIILCCALGCAILGAKILYVFVSYGLDQVLLDLKMGSLNFLNSAGIVYYGGLLGGIAGGFLGTAIAPGQRTDMLLQAVVPCIPLGHGIGRIGCLFAGCCYGLPYDGVGAVTLAGAGIQASVFPIQLVEAGCNILLFLLLLALSERLSGVTLLGLYLACYAGMRFILEFFRGDVIRGVVHGLSTSQWISLILFAGSVVLMLWSKARTGRQGLDMP